MVLNILCRNGPYRLVCQVCDGDKYYFDSLHKLHQVRYYRLVKQHVHSVNGAVTGLSALPSTAQPMASVKAMSRFLNDE